MKSILIAIDDSESSKSALNIGLEVAKITGAKVKGLYIEDISRLLEWQPVELMGAAVGAVSAIPTSRPTVEQVEVEKGFIKESESLHKLFKDKCKSYSVDGIFLTKRGNVDELIYEFAKTVDLVIIGRRGKTYPENSSEPGPRTENLLRNTTRPVLVVPPKAQLNNKILIAYDGGKTAQRALMAGAVFASLQKSEVKVVSIADDIDTAEKPLNEAKEFLSAYNLNATYVIDFEKKKPWKAIMDQAKIWKSGLIVLGAFGENKLLELIFGSTTREVLMQATCPVLLCR